MIKQTKNGLPVNSLKTLYHVLIHPHLSYGILAWSSAKSYTLNKTEILRKHDIKL